MKNIWLVFENVNTKIGPFLFFLLLGFALINPIWNINGVRMWTAAQVFLYGNLLYFLKSDKKGLFWSASSFLIHFSFLFPIILLFTFIFIPKNVKLLFAFFLVTRLFVEIELSGVRELLYNLPDAFIPRVESYTSETYAAMRDEASQSLNWYVGFLSNALKWFVTIWVILLFSKYQIWKNNSPKIAKLFLFTLFIGGFANLAAQVPSGGRFLVLSNSLLFVVLISLISINRTYWISKVYQYLTMPLLILGLILQIRLGLSFIGLSTIFGNPIIAPFLEDRTPLIEYLDWLI